MMRRVLATALLLAVCVPPVAAERESGGSILFETGYGKRLPGSTGDVALWWASSGWKVSEDRPVPRKSARALEIRAARNEVEAAQLVVRPRLELTGFTAEGSVLEADGGARIPAENVEVLRVRYVFVDRPTDEFGARANWPDPLPPFKGPITLRPGKNQPLWVRVKVPRDAAPGVYRGVVRLNADGYAAEAPIRAVVYDFELPDTMTCTTALGFDAGAVYRYQNIPDPERRSQVLNKYWEDYSAHHISPYGPTPSAPFTVEWVKLTKAETEGMPAEDRELLEEHPLTPRFDWSKWDAEMARVIDAYHFTTFRLGGPGLGGEMQGFQADSRGYWLAFTAYWQALQEHFREKGWLDMAYVYWFDEPTKRQYAYVKDGFVRLKKAAPDIKGMITEHVVPELVGGPDIWCPDTWWYDHEEALKRGGTGEIFWWYVCTLPKEPYPGLFTDHPGTDMRVWLWQTWKYGIEGILVWASNLWTTSPAYPNHPQNPYEDAMSWVSGAGMSAEDKEPWGNGDGRFVYPPEAAGGIAEETILDGPVDSIRWEMLRDGIEDYEYLAILKRLLDADKDLSPRKRRRFEALLQVPDAITSDLKTYTKDPAPIEERRDRVARAIEALSKPR